MVIVMVAHSGDQHPMLTGLTAGLITMAMGIWRPLKSSNNDWFNGNEKNGCARRWAIYCCSDSRSGAFLLISYLVNQLQMPLKQVVQFNYGKIWLL